MAIDKAVDSKALDTLFKNIGNAIREKDGTTALITPEIMPAKIRAIQTGVDTSDATVTAGDMSYGVVAYGKDGQVYGGVPTIDGNSEKALENSMVGFHEGLGKIQLAQRIPRLGILFREGSTVILNASPSEFGDATAADVAKGKTFTSAAGLRVVGTAESSTADPLIGEVITEQITDVKIDGSKVLYLRSTTLTSWLTSYNVTPVAVYLYNSGDDVTGGTEKALYTANLAPVLLTNKFLCIETYINSSGGYGVSRSTAATGALSISGTEIYVKLVGPGVVSSRSAITAYCTYVITSRKQ